jgi:transposase-like protein
MTTNCLHCENTSVIRSGRDKKGKQRFKCNFCGKTFIKQAKVELATKQKALGKKQAQKGLKSTRGRPELYDQAKQQASIMVTPDGLAGLDQQAQAIGLSRSEFCERIGRGMLKLENQ